MQTVELALGHSAELAEDGVLVLGDAPVDDPSQLEGDRTGLAHGQVVQSGLSGRGDRDPVGLPAGIYGSWGFAGGTGRAVSGIVQLSAE